MPPDYLSNKTFETEPGRMGIVPKNRAVYSQLCSVLGLETPEYDEPLDWDLLGQAMLHRRALQAGIFNDQEPMILTEERASEILKVLERKVLVREKELFGINDQEAGWDEVVAVYNSFLSTLNPESYEQEMKRHGSAFFLQISRRSATWEEIYAEIEALGLSDLVVA